MFLFGIASYMSGQFLTDAVIVRGDFAGTADNVAASDHAYRVGLMLMLVTSWGTVLLAGVLYLLLKPVAPMIALFALLWRAAEATLGGVASVLRYAGLHNYTTSGADIGTRQLLGKLIAAGVDDTINGATLFFAAGSFLFFSLLFRSRFMPRALSALGVFASLAIGVLGCAHLVLSEPPPALEYAGAPIFVAEIVTGFWLLLAGANFNYWNNRVTVADS